MKDQITVTLKPAAARQLITYILNDYEFSDSMRLDSLNDIAERIAQLEALHTLKAAMGDLNDES